MEKRQNRFVSTKALSSHGRCRSAWATRYHSDGQFKVTIRRPFSCPRGMAMVLVALRFEVPEMRFDGYYRIDWLFSLMEGLTCEFLRYAFLLLRVSGDVLNVTCRTKETRFSKITELWIRSRRTFSSAIQFNCEMCQLKKKYFEKL